MKEIACNYYRQFFLCEARYISLSLLPKTLSPIYMRQLLLFLTLLFLPYFLHAQNVFTLSGSVKDTINFTNTGYTSISLIRASDSILQTFTRSDEEGNFVLKTDKADTFLLLISHPSFATLVDVIAITKEQTDIGMIALLSRKQLLQEVVITDAKAIVIKGDTVEYSADSFKTRAFDNVDELLKKLPGIEVGRDGKIKAYGKTVEKMLVDGEEFFSDDPAVVSQTLRAASVDKVQVFDKKSDQAVFTGVDDGELTKTINLQLKDDAKKGYFGKLSTGGGLPGYWEQQAMINSFKKKRKISAFAVMSNTNTSGLGWDDGRKYGGENNSFSEGDDGMWTREGSFDDDNSWNGEYSGKGLPRTWTGGTHYSNKWKGDTIAFNGSYRFNRNIVEGFDNSRTQYILPDTQYVSNQNSSNTNISNRHSISTVTEYQIDTTSSIKLNIGGSYRESNTANKNQSQSTSMEGGLINDKITTEQYESDTKSVRASLLYRKRFRKKGRSFSADFTGDWNAGTNNGSLLSSYNLFAIDSAYTINQRKKNDNTSLTGRVKLSYTEPLSKVMNLETNYSLGYSSNDAERSSFDRTNGAAEGDGVFNPLFSSHYVFNTTQNQGGANLRFNLKKIKFSLGGNVSYTGFKQEDKLFDTSYTYSYLNFFPKASLSFNKSQSSSLSLYYNGSTRQPTISQLQPLRDNTDPLNIALGNPELKQQFSHNLRLNFNSYKMLTNENIYGNLGVTLLQNAISQQQNVDISGRRTYQYINVNGNFNTYAYLGYGRKLIKDLYSGIGLSGSYARRNNFINGLSNRTDNFSFSPELNFDYNKDTSINIRYNFNPTYTLNESSVRSDIKTKYWTFAQSFDGSINLPLKFTLGTSITWDIRQRLDPQDKNNNVFRWNAYVSKAFLKDRSLVAKLFAYDILDQNVGYTRNNSADYIAENTYNTIRRYFMLSLTWNFTRSGTKEPKGDDMIIIGE